ncbi:hypothetical protein [Thaumasiovibrio subtropicus]|uniref:hypothetical protein n=1 Tax=Thaumasiovibrio subtropicus TaxID=1891207 RepID=UPI000B34DE9A|nr:hypothetical protein [Thaumasiovibrio subtropicus]
MWQQWSEKFIAMSSREKFLIALLGWAAILLGGGLQLLEPQYLSTQQTHTDLRVTEQSIRTRQQQVELAQFRLQQDPDKELNEKIVRLVSQEQALRAQLEDRVSELVTPSHMAIVVEQALEKTGDVKLQAMRSLPSRKLRANQGSGYYIHPVELVLQGGYSDIYRYLTALEAMPVVFYWESFHYEVDAHPNAQLRLVLYTLGPREVFISG